MNNILKLSTAFALLSVAAHAGDQVNASGAGQVAVIGYDTVAFRPDSKTENGSRFLSAEYQGAACFFTREEHRALFTANPESRAEVSRGMPGIRCLNPATSPKQFQPGTKSS